MGKEKVRIIVAGVSGSGKSTIVQIIAKALKAHGIQHEVSSSLVSENQLVGAVFQSNRVKAVKKKTEISLEELHMHRFERNERGTG